MQNKIYIYGLHEVNHPEQIKYIGKTHQKINKRIHDHIRESAKLKTKKDFWIQSVINTGGSITYKIIETHNDDSWIEREKYWISTIDGLLNISKGGDGGRGLAYEKTYDELKQFVHTEQPDIKNRTEWMNYVKAHPEYLFLPMDPYSVYKTRGWINWKDFLINYNGDKSVRNPFRQLFNYKDCKEFIKVYSIKNSIEWRKCRKTLDPRIPTAPDRYYKKTNEWKGWPDFLDNGNERFNNLKIY